MTDYRRSPGLVSKSLQPKKGGSLKASGGERASPDDEWEVGRLVTSADIRALQDSSTGGAAPAGFDDLLSDVPSKSSLSSITSSVTPRNTSKQQRPTSAQRTRPTSGGRHRPPSSTADSIPPSIIDENYGMGGGRGGRDLGSEASGASGYGGGSVLGDGNQGGNAADVDELTLLTQDTPLVRLKAKEEEVAQAVAQGADAWRVLRLQQEVLALAKLHTLLHRSTDHRPLLMPTAHFQLAQRYSDLGCIAQASDHLQKSIDELPAHGQSRKDVKALKKNVNICMAEALMKGDPPKPQVALQHLLAAADKETVEEVKELDIAMLMSQAYVAIAESKLNEARSTKLARNRLDITIDEVAINVRKAEVAKRVLEVASLRQRLSDLENEAQAEKDYEGHLVKTVLGHLDTASTIITNMCEQEEKRLSSDQRAGDPVYQQLVRQGNRISLKEAEALGLKGDTVQQERALREILSSHVQYGLVPDGMMARVRKELGAAFATNKKYDEALECYDELKQLQQERFSEDFAQQELASAECYKLSGDVFVAKREFGRAREHFGIAYDMFVLELGPNHQLVLDLEHRLRELDNYDDAHARAEE